MKHKKMLQDISFKISYWYDEIKLFFKSIKWAFQRMKRGYSDEDCWAIDYYLCEILPPMLRSLKDSSGCPTEYYQVKEWKSEERNPNCIKWHEALEEMAQGFEAGIELNEVNYMDEIIENGKVKSYKYNKQKHEELKSKLNKGLKLFSENFLSLWD